MIPFPFFSQQIIVFFVNKLSQIISKKNTQSKFVHYLCEPLARRSQFVDRKKNVDQQLQAKTTAKLSKMFELQIIRLTKCFVSDGERSFAMRRTFVRRTMSVRRT